MCKGVDYLRKQSKYKVGVRAPTFILNYRLTKTYQIFLPNFDNASPYRDTYTKSHVKIIQNRRWNL